MRRLLPLLLVLAVLTLLLAPSTPNRSEGDDENSVTLAVNGKKWSEVFKWLSRATGKPINLSYGIPQGVCNVTAPRGKVRTFNEFIDLLNEDLFDKNRPQPYYLFPKVRTIVVIPWEFNDPKFSA